MKQEPLGHRISKAEPACNVIPSIRFGIGI